MKDEIGFWGTPTSTLDWCEANYENTYFIAEFWNTVSNLGMIIPPVYGIYDCYRQGLENKFIVNYVLLLLTGIGSLMFHMTLKYEMQLLDELPMVWGASYMLYTLYEIHMRTEKGTAYVGIGIVAYSSILTISYLIFPNPIYYEVMYGILILANIILGMRRSYIDGGQVTGILFFGGLLLYAIGFVFWNIDNHFCSFLSSFRENVRANNDLLTIISPLTQLHGWWHLLAGYAGYIHIIVCIQHRLKYLKMKTSLEGSVVGLKVVVIEDFNHNKLK